MNNRIISILKSKKTRLLALLLIIAAIPLTLVLNQQTQNLQPQALSNSKLGVYFLNVDLSANGPHRQIIAGCPRFVKVNDPQQHGTHLDLLKLYKQQCPGGQTIMRVIIGAERGNAFYNVSNPANAAADAEHFWNTVLAPQVARLGSNKQYVDFLAGPNEDDNHGYPRDNPAAYEWTNTFYSTLADKISAAGFKPFIGQVGAFFEGGALDLRYVHMLQGSLNHIRDLGGVWSVHPYTNTYSKDYNTELRTSLWHKKIAEKVGPIPMVFGEAGFNGARGGGSPDDGWKNLPSCGGNATCAQQKYEEWLAWWDSQLGDSYVKGVTIFQGGGSLAGQWTTFEMDPLACWLRQHLGGGPCTSGPPPANTDAPPPPGQNQKPVGFLDTVDGQGVVKGWTKDPDVPNNTINAHFWVDGPEGQGQYAGATLASRSRGDPAVDPHAFEFVIPNFFRDGQNHQIYGYGLDYQGAANGLLGGSPLNFNLSTSAPPDPTNVPPPTGGGNPNPQTQPPTLPSNLRANCNVPNRTVKLEWSRSERADFYFLHIRGAVSKDERVYATYYTMPIQLGNRYSWWLEAVNHDTNFQPRSTASAGGEDFTCQTERPPDPPPDEPPPGGNSGKIILQFINEANAIVDVYSGIIFTGEELGGDSDAYNIGTARNTTSPGCFTKIGPGRFQCVNRRTDTRWYGGVADTQPHPGYNIIDKGTVNGEDTPVTVPANGEVVITIKIQLIGDGGRPTPTPGPNPSYTPNCSNIQGPTTIRLGQRVTYLANFIGPDAARLLGTINAVKTTNTTPTNASSWDWNETDTNSPNNNYPPQEVLGTSGSLSYSWTPASAGVYQVFCRAWNATTGNTECRGATNTVDGPPRYTCNGPGAVITVNVTSASIDESASTTDMCQAAITIGGNVMSLGGNAADPNAPITIAALPKPGFNIKTYSFAFYNQDNQPSDPKPVFFEAGKHFIIDSSTNTITVQPSQLNRPDLNFGDRKPVNMQVHAFFTDVSGQISSKSPNCVAYVKITEPTPIVNATVTPTPTPSPSSDRTALLATVGVLLIAIIVSLNFFFS